MSTPKDSLLANMLDFTQYIAACASTSRYENDIISKIRDLQPRIKHALATTRPSAALTESHQRVGKYLDELARMPRLHQEEITGLHIGDEREAVLLVSDLRALLAASGGAHAVPDDTARLDCLFSLLPMNYFCTALNIDPPANNEPVQQGTWARAELDRMIAAAPTQDQGEGNA